MAEIPAANGHGTALAVATTYGALADGSERLLKRSTMELGRTGQGWCVDAVAGAGNEFGLGFTLGSRQRSFGPPAPSATTGSAARPASWIPRAA
jgi:hypothetical protein